MLSILLHRQIRVSFFLFFFFILAFFYLIFVIFVFYCHVFFWLAWTLCITLIWVAESWDQEACYIFSTNLLTYWPYHYQTDEDVNYWNKNVGNYPLHPVQNYPGWPLRFSNILDLEEQVGQSYNIMWCSFHMDQRCMEPHRYSKYEKNILTVRLVPQWQSTGHVVQDLGSIPG